MTNQGGPARSPGRPVTTRTSGPSTKMQGAYCQASNKTPGMSPGRDVARRGDDAGGTRCQAQPAMRHVVASKNASPSPASDTVHVDGQRNAAHATTASSLAVCTNQ